MNNIIEKMKTTKILAVIGIVGLILGTMFPYVSYSVFESSVGISMWNYWEGKIVLTLAIANLIFIFKDFVEKYIPSLFNTNIGQKIADINNPKASLVPTVIALIFALYLHFKLDVDWGNYSIGFYLLWLGVIALVAYAFLYKSNNETRMEDKVDNNKTEENN